MIVKSGALRYSIAVTLLKLADVDYQREIWVEVDTRALPPNSFSGIQDAMEAYVEAFTWETEGELIGFVFRTRNELEACLKVYELLLNFYTEEKRAWSQKQYLHDPAWPQIVAASRRALRVLNEGDL